MGRPKVNHEFDERVEALLASNLLTGEYETYKGFSRQDNEDYETYVALLDADRPEKEYDWMSDISIPEFAAHILTQSSLDVAQYFQTRDFVECYIEDEEEQSIRSAAASKELINRTLNQNHLYHYFKFVRGKLNNNLSGRVYAECWWEQETRQDIVGITSRREELDYDIYGNDIVDKEIQVPATKIVEEPQYGRVPVIDRFNYEILDPRNVVTDNKYVYSLQQKDFIYIRSEKTLTDLKKAKAKEGYINLHLLEEKKGTEQTETARETRDKEKNKPSPAFTGEKPFDIYKRYGKYWAIVQERAEDQYPIKIKPGIDSDGKPMSNAELIEMIMVFAKAGGHSTLIAFHPTPYVDAVGTPYKPVIRGLCYIHPSRDGGMGDGKYARELQKGIDDTFNVGNDRVMLATLPTMKGKRYVTEDNSSIRIEPEHVIELENPKEDLVEMEISDNIQGAMGQIAVLSTKMDQVMSIYPTTMGDLPGRASTTATAVVGAQGQASNRTNYKSMTFEHTFLHELYWMIEQMTFTFAYPQTGIKLMGKKVYDFNPILDYTFKPLSQSIESEQSKMAKLRMWQQIFAIAVQTGKANTINYVFAKMCELMGDEFVNFAEAFLATDIEPKGQGGAEGQPGMEGSATNQYQMPMSPQEGGAREAMGGYG